MYTRRRGGSYYGRGSDKPTTLHAYSWKDRKDPQQLATRACSGYSLSPDGKPRADPQGRRVPPSPRRRRPVPSNSRRSADQLDLAQLKTTKVAADEHWQIFREVWRRYRDFFYVANMHGHDWQSNCASKYAPLVAHVRHRSDLNHLLGEMIAELNVGHAYVSRRGPRRTQADRQVALPGRAPGVRRTAASRYRIARAAAWRERRAPPTVRRPTAVGAAAEAGNDYLLAIDGYELQPSRQPLRAAAGQGSTAAVHLTVHSQPALA